MNLEQPLRFVVVDERDFRTDRRVGVGLRREHRANLVRDLRRLVAADVEPVIRRVQPRVHLLLRERRLTPAEIRHAARAVRERFPAPQPHHARQRRRIPQRPVHRTRLLLHHPERQLRHAAIHIVIERREVGMAAAQPARLDVRREPLLFERAERIAVPGRDIEIGGDLVVIELGEELHEVVRDRPARRMRANDLDLHAVVARHFVGRETPVIEAMRRMRFGHGRHRRVDLVEAAVLHAPEHRAPRVVQCIDRVIARLQPFTKAPHCRRRIADHRVMAAEFVIGLPERDRRMLAVALGDRRADALRCLEIRRRRKIVVTPRAERARTAIGADRQDVRMTVDQPLGRRRGRRAHDDLADRPRPARRSRDRASPSRIRRASARCGSTRIRRSAPVRCRALSSGERRLPTSTPASVPGNSRLQGASQCLPIFFTRSVRRIRAKRRQSRLR